MLIIFKLRFWLSLYNGAQNKRSAILDCRHACGANLWMRLMPSPGPGQEPRLLQNAFGPTGQSGEAIFDGVNAELHHGLLYRKGQADYTLPSSCRGWKMSSRI